MCANMKEFQTVSEKLFELEQKKAIKKKEMDALEKEIKQLKSETSSYMKKRQKNELTVAGLTVLFAAYGSLMVGNKTLHTTSNRHRAPSEFNRLCALLVIYLHCSNPYKPQYRK